jgi:lysophospholipase L1-like esterase
VRRAVLLLVIGALALGACGPIDPVDGAATTSVPTAPLRGDALFLGDSLTVGARDEGGLVDRATAVGIDADILAQESQAVPWGLRIVQARPQLPRVVVVELGTNPNADDDDFAMEVEALVTALHAGGAQLVAWVTPVHRDDRYEDKIEVLREAEAAGLLVVADWEAQVRDNPDWLSRDGIHYTTEGYTALATFLAVTAWTLLDAEGISP